MPPPVLPTLAQLRTCPLFTTLDESILEQVQQLSTLRQILARRYLMSADMPGENVYVLLRGLVKVTGEQPDGSIVLRAVLGPGQLIGEIAVLDHQARTATVQTIEPSELICFGRDEFERCLLLDARIPLQLSRLLAQRLRRSIDRFHSLATEDARIRVARLLLELAQEQQELATTSLSLPLSQEELASMVGMSRGHFSKLMQEFRNQQILLYGRPGTIQVASWQRLRQIVESDTAPF